jgi:hypothetical protein
VLEDEPVTALQAGLGDQAAETCPL